MGHCCWIVCEAILLQFILMVYGMEPKCKLPALPDLQGMSMPGDILLGVNIAINTDKIYQAVTFKVKPPEISCTLFSVDHFQTLQTLIFTLEEINRDHNILPNITLGFQMYDTCSAPNFELQGALRFLTKPTKEGVNNLCNSSAFFPAILASTVSTNSIILAQVLGTFKYPQLTRYIRKVRVTLSYGKEIYFDDSGDPISNYSVVNWQKAPDGSVRHVQVGNMLNIMPPEQGLFINSSMIIWPKGNQQVPRSVCSESCPTGFRKASLTGQPSCCFECLPCLEGEISNQSDSLSCFRCPWDQWPNIDKSNCDPKPMEFLSYEDVLGATLAAVSLISSLIPALVLWLFVHHNNTPVVKANNYSLSCLLLVSLCLCFLSSLGFIGYPQPEMCLLHQVSFGLVFTLCISCILAKTFMVVFAFMATKPGSTLKKWTSPRVSYTLILTCFLMEFVLCTFWLLLAPPFPQNNINTKPGIIIVDCNEGSPTAFWTMLGYLFFLATISFIVAFLARRLPDSFNEAQFITFSMLAFLSVWISYIPASLSAQGKYTVAMEVFAILASSWALVICMFLPKCFIILFRPDMNTREYLMKRENRNILKYT